MKIAGRKRLIFLISTLVALALTSTAMGEVIIDNAYIVHISPSTPEVNLTNGNNSLSGSSLFTNYRGTVAYANLTEFFHYSTHKTSVNLSNLLFLASRTPGSFYYTVNVTTFTGYPHLANLSLYSVNSSGEYIQNFNYSLSNGNTTGNTPVNVKPGTHTGLGLHLSVGSKDLGAYTWKLDLQINGYFTSSGSSKVVFTQYYIYFLITTTEEV